MQQAIHSLLPASLRNSRLYSVVVTDLAGNYTFVNDFFKHKYSFLCEDFVGQHSFIAIHPDDRLACLQAVEQCLAYPDAAFTVKMRKPSPVPNIFYWTMWEFSVLKGATEEPMGILCIGHDITESESQSLLVTKFSQKIENILEEISDGFYQLDKDWNFVKVNKVAQDILGVSATEIVGKCLWNAFPATPEYNYPTYYRRALEEQVSLTFEDYRPDLQKWFRAVVYPSVEGLSVFFRDITQEKKNQLALQQSENKLKAILDNTVDSIILMDVEGKILTFNKTAKEQFTDYFQQEITTGKYLLDILPAKNREIFTAYFPLALQGERNITEIERSLHGQKHWFEIAYFPVYDSESRLIGVSKNTRDITNKKQSEHKIKEQEYLLHAIYQSTSEASTFIDRELIIRYNNQVAREITRQVFGRAATVGENSLDYVLPEYRAEFAAYYAQVLQGESIVVERTDGQHWWQFSMYPVYDQTNQTIGIAHNVQDITERKNRELTILEQNKKLRDINWQQSHELRKPVATILGLCDLLKNYGNEPSKIQQEYIDYFLHTVNELDGIIHKIVLQADEGEYGDV